MEPYVDRQIDVTSIPFDDNSFDAVYCSHVLEHVPDDAKALKEFHRILKPSGWALPVVPITAARTIEDPSVTEPAERLRLFGQDDHVRRYGPDYADRLQSAGFSVKVFNPQDLALSRDVERMALGHVRQPLHFCRKS